MFVIASSSVVPLGNSKHFAIIERNDVLYIVKPDCFADI